MFRIILLNFFLFTLLHSSIYWYDENFDVSNMPLPPSCACESQDSEHDRAWVVNSENDLANGGNLQIIEHADGNWWENSCDESLVGFRQYYDLDLYYGSNYFHYKEREYSYRCTECPRVEATNRDMNVWRLDSTAINADLLPLKCASAPFEIENTVIDCVGESKCYEPIPDCSSKGEDWVYNSSSAADDCFVWVEYDNYDSADFTDNICCLHETPDNNDTDPSPSPSPSPSPDPSSSPSPSPSPTPDPSSSPSPTPNPDCTENQRSTQPCASLYIWQESTCSCVRAGAGGDGGGDGDSGGGDGDGDSGGGDSTTDDILNGIKADGESQHSDSMEKMTETNNILNGIKSDMTSQAATNHEDLNDVKSSVNSVKSSVDSASATNHADLGKIDTTLGEIKEGTDALKDLKDEGATAKEEQSTDLSDGYEGITSSISDVQTAGDNMLSSVVSSYANTPPILVGSGDCVFTANIYNKPVTLDFNRFDQYRPTFDTLWALLLAFLSFKMYFIVFKSIAEVLI